MKCKDCKYLTRVDHISLISQMMGYTAECSKTGILFHLEISSECPQWCPLREEWEKEKRFLA